MKFIATLFIFSFTLLGTCYSQTLFNPNKFGVGYNFSTTKRNEYNVQTHTAYLSTGQKDFFVSYTNLHSGNNSIGEWGFGLNIYRIDHDFFYPSLTVMFEGTNKNLGLGLGANMAFRTYHRRYVNIFPEVGININLLKASGGELVNGGSFSVNTGLNVGFYPTQKFILTITPEYIFSAPYSSLLISFGVIYKPEF